MAKFPLVLLRALTIGSPAKPKVGKWESWFAGAMWGNEG